MNTEPVAIAASSFAPTGSRANAPMNGPCGCRCCNPAALATKARYGGALSSTLDNVPDAQKKCQGFVNMALEPWLQALRISSTGAIVMKIAANRMATSMNGLNVKRFLVRCSCDPAK